MSVLVEMERELNVERTRVGLAVAREQERDGGRRRVMTEESGGAMPQDVGYGLNPAAGSRCDRGVKTIYKYFPAS